MVKKSILLTVSKGMVGGVNATLLFYVTNYPVITMQV